MTRLAAMLVFLLCAAAAIAHAAHDNPPAQDQVASPPSEKATRLNERLMELDARVANVADLRATFVQEKFTALLKQPLRSSGTVTVKGPAVRWDTLEPAPSTMTVTPKEIRIYDPVAAIVEILTTGGDIREMTSSPLPRMQTLRTRFDISEMEVSELGLSAHDAGALRLLGLTLTPASGELKRHITRVRVVIDTALPALIKMEITDADDERSVLTLSDIALNGGVRDDEVALHVPEGTRESRPLGAGSGGGP